MEHFISMNFQEILKGEIRPSEEFLNYKDIFSNNLGNVPNVGDYIEFSHEEDGQIGIYKVKTRYFRYSLKNSKCNVTCNIVVERHDDDAPILIKE